MTMLNIIVLLQAFALMIIAIKMWVMTHWLKDISRRITELQVMVLQTDYPERADPAVDDTVKRFRDKQRAYEYNCTREDMDEYCP